MINHQPQTCAKAGGVELQETSLVLTQFDSLHPFITSWMLPYLYSLHRLTCLVHLVRITSSVGAGLDSRFLDGHTLLTGRHGTISAPGCCGASARAECAYSCLIKLQLIRRICQDTHVDGLVDAEHSTGSSLMVSDIEREQYRLPQSFSLILLYN
jgi:hypothetical protein